jgi:hypothetical protein
MTIDPSDPKQTGSLGGKARAKSMTKAQLVAGSRTAVATRWAVRATHMGKLPLCDQEIPCANLEDGRRVISTTAFLDVLGRARPGGQTYRRRLAAGRDELPIFLASKRLDPFIPKDFSVATICYSPVGNGPMVEGIDAQAVPSICRIWIQAWSEGALLDRQIPTAKAAAAIVGALAHVGIAALVDEATGYQADRSRDALAAILEAFIGKELAAWAKTFDDDYYKEIYRLRGWANDYLAAQKPPLVGKLTENIVYSRLAPAVLEELKRKNPKMASGHRRTKHHQWLTSQMGHPKLREHLAKVVALMQVSTSWDEFMTRLDYVAPRHTGYLFNYAETLPRLLSAPALM